MTKKLSAIEKARLVKQQPTPAVSAPSSSVSPDTKSVAVEVVRSPSRPRTALGIASAQFFENDKTLAENERLKQELQEWSGANATKKLDPKVIKPTRWANRNEKSFDGPDFIALKAEIKSAGGNVQPIKVRPIPGSMPQEYEVVFGHRRHRACLELGFNVLAMIEPMDNKSLFMEMDRENRQRADLRPYEQGVMYKRALDEGLFPSLRRMAEELGVDHGNVSKYVDLARLPIPIIEAFHSPLDLQQAWALKLKEALSKNTDFVLAKAREIQSLKDKPTSADVFRLLTSVDVVSNNTPEVIKLKGASSRTGVINWSERKRQIQVTLNNVDHVKLAEVQKAIQKILG